MIAKTQGYSTSDGRLCATLAEAQEHELGILFAESGHPLIGQIMQHSDEVLAILTMTPRSKPKARKVAGTTNPKRAARKAASTVEVPATASQVAEGFAAMRAELV